MMLRNWIRDSFPRLRYWVNCWLFRNDKDFRKKVIAIKNSPFMFLFENLGPLNPDKNICVMGTDDNGITQGGLTAELHNLMVVMAMCDHFHLYPVVEFCNSLYDDCNSKRGQNAFEYYFEQPVGISVEDAKKSQYVYFSRGIDIQGFQNLDFSYDYNENVLDRYASIYRRYFRLRQNVQDQIERDIFRIIGKKKVLGIHIRGGDFNGNYYNHPIPLVPEDYYELIDSLLLEVDYDAIFLATDDGRVLRKMLEKYAEKIVLFENNKRTENDIGVHHQKNEENDEGYTKGFEVLRDAYALAKCEDLIVGLSSVSTYARIVRKANYPELRDANVINKGVCKSGRVFPQRRK